MSKYCIFSLFIIIYIIPFSVKIYKRRLNNNINYVMCPNFRHLCLYVLTFPYKMNSYRMRTSVKMNIIIKECSLLFLSAYTQKNIGIQSWWVSRSIWVYRSRWMELQISPAFGKSSSADILDWFIVCSLNIQKLIVLIPVSYLNAKFSPCVSGCYHT